MRLGVLVVVIGQGVSGLLLVLGALFASSLMGPERLGQYTEYTLIAGFMFAACNLGLHGWVARGIHSLGGYDAYLMQQYVLTALKLAATLIFLWLVALVALSLLSSDTAYFIWLSFSAASWVFARSVVIYTISALQAIKSFFAVSIIRVAAVLAEYTVVLLVIAFVDASALARAASQSIGWVVLVLATGFVASQKYFPKDRAPSEQEYDHHSKFLEAVRFSRNTGPHVIFSYAAANLDKMALALVATNEELGVYAFASTLAMVLGTFAEALNFAMTPYSYDLISRKNYGMRGLTGLVVSAALVTAVSGVALAILTNYWILQKLPAYVSAWESFSVLISAQAVRAFTMYTSAILTYKKKTQYQSFSTVTALMIVCILAASVPLAGTTVAWLYLLFTVIQFILTSLSVASVTN